MFFRWYLIWFGTTLCLSCGGFSIYFWVMFDCEYEKGAFPLSKAGVKSTSLGMMPLFTRLNIPSEISFSVIGGGSAKGSSLKFFGRIRLAKKTLLGRLVPMPSFSSSILLIPPWALPYLNWFGYGRAYFSLRNPWPVVFSGSLVR